jgi:uncharacterized phiE125 gp8 family phage protein
MFSLDEVKRYLRVDFNDDDVLIDSLITAATNHVEQHLGRTLLKTRYKLAWQCCRNEQYLDYFVVHLPMGPAISVEKVFDCHRQEKLKRVSVDLESNKPNVMFACNHEHLLIEYTAGYGETPECVPAEIRQATLSIVAELYRNRDTVTPAGLKSFLEGLLFCHMPKRLG